MIANLAIRGIAAAAENGKKAAQQQTRNQPQRRKTSNKRVGDIHQPLDDISRWQDTIIYATPEQKDAALLTYAVSHDVWAFNAVPRLLVTSKFPLSGKTTVLDMGSYLCQNPWWSNSTSFALRAKFNGPETPTPIFDEISKIFGEAGLRGRSNPLYQILVEGYRRSATLSLSVDRSETQVSCYGVALCAGLGTAAPKDLRTRCIIIEMKPVPDNVKLDDSLDPGVEAVGRAHGERLHAWMRLHHDELTQIAKNVRRYHPKLRGRKLQIWGPLFAVATIAGGNWPERCLRAFTTLALDASDKPILSPEERVLMDAAAFIRSHEETPRVITSAGLLDYLNMQDYDVYKAQSERQMAILMSSALGSASVVTLPDRRKAKGWHVKGVLSAAQQLEDALSDAEGNDEVEDEFDSFFADVSDEVTEVTEVTEV